MSNKMLLSINNLCPINNAELDIAKINVVVGKNSTENPHQVNFFTVF